MTKTKPLAAKSKTPAVKKPKAARPILKQPLVTGQLWRVMDMNLRVGLIGKILVHYKLAKPNAVRIPNSVSGFQIGGLAEKCRPEIDERVGAEHQCIGKFFGNGARLAVGVELGDFAGGELIVVNFGGVAGHDREVHPELAQQFRAARRSGSQDERRQIHARQA